jgi:hypothetical protein
MSFTNDDINVAQNLISSTTATVFFEKLAACGIAPANEADARRLATIGSNLLTERPRRSQSGLQVKQASMQAHGEISSPYNANGFTEEAVTLAQELCNNPNFVRAACILNAMSAQ